MLTCVACANACSRICKTVHHMHACVVGHKVFYNCIIDVVASLHEV